MGHGDVPPPLAQGQMPPAPGAAPYPYPPAGPQQQGMTAPGGYPVMSPVAGPSSGYPHAVPPSTYPPQPNPDALEPPVKPSPAAAGGMPPPSTYPPAGPYPPAPAPAGYPSGIPGAGPAPGYPVMGTPAAAPVGGMSVEQGSSVPPGQEPCGCTVGWVLFGIGFIFWPCWVAAAFVPLCTRSRSDRLAGIASTIGMVILVILGIALGVSSSKMRSN